MIRKIILGTLLGTICFLSACGDIGKLNEVKKIAVAGLTFTTDFTVVDENGNEVSDMMSTMRMVGNVGNALTGKDAIINPEVENFYLSLFKRIMRVFTNDGFEMVLADTFSDNNIFKQFNFNREPTSYNPKPFASGLYTPKVELTTQLAKEIGADALGYFTFKILRMKSSGGFMGLMPEEKLGLEARLTLVHKDGTPIIINQVFTAYSEPISDWGLFGDVLQINGDAKQMFEQVKEEFVAVVQKKLGERTK